VGIRCINSNCIVHEEKEAPYVQNKFHLVGSSASPINLRCVYCESDIDEFVIASKKNRWFSADPATLDELSGQNVRDFIFFAAESDAVRNGFHPRKHSRPKRIAGSR
jgi:hypothetical protein